jgi:uncharacterized protein (DUF486 family)
MKALTTLVLLLLSNTFMTLAWYGHLKWGGVEKGSKWGGLLVVILISWGIAFFEYLLQVPANRWGFKGNGGPFTLVQLKVIQEVMSLTVFVAFAALFFKGESLKWNHAVAFVLLVLAVYLVFKR